MGYDVFISYSHGDDDLLSERVQEALSKFAKPWYRRHALRVFRDRTALSANPGLWSSISESLDESRYFLFLASPDAAASIWCSREVEHFRERHGAQNMLLLLTDGTILWDENANEFDWSATTALGPAFAGAFREEPFFVDMRWARSETQLDLTDGRFRSQIADLAAPVHGMAKDELASEDVRQHRRTMRLAIAASVLLALLTVAAIVTSFFAVSNASAARKNAAEARKQQGFAERNERQAQANLRKAKEEQRQKEIEAAEKVRQTKIAVANEKKARQQEKLANDRSIALGVANNNLTIGGRELRKSTLLAQARLAARRSEQLMSSGDQTYQLGLLMAAEAVRHACASSAIDPNAPANADTTYPNDGCTQPGVQIDGSVANRALGALSNAGGRFATGRLAGSNSPHLVSWSFDGQRFATFSSAQSDRPEVVQVWNADGSLAAAATSTAGLTADSALSGDGSVVALTANAADASVSAWSVSSRRAVTSGALAGRRPALSANGASMAWLARRQAKSVYISINGGAVRTVALPAVPADVAMNADGSLVAVLVHRDGDDYSVIPIDAVTGKVGAARDVGNFATVKGSYWKNPPRVSPNETADPPSLWFAPDGATAWVYNNERHVGLQVLRSGTKPTARRTTVRSIPPLGGNDPSTLVTSTPDGRTVVFVNPNNAPPTYQVWTEAAGWTTPGLVPLELCASDTSCAVSLSPNGTELAVSALSALQIIDVRSPASTSSNAIPNGGALDKSSSVVASPTGRTALNWTAHSLVLVDTANHAARRVAVPLRSGDAVNAVGFDPQGLRYVAVVARNGACPCRVVTIDAMSGSVLTDVGLAATALDRIADEHPVGVTLNDAADLVAVTFDDNLDSSGTHRAALAAYSARTGQALQVAENGALGIGTQLVSVPAFRPGSDTVALVATSGAAHEVGGVLLDARTGAIEHTVAMKAGVVTVNIADYGNDGYALRFSPNGQLLAWNTGGSVVIWDIGAAAATPRVESDVVLTSLVFFDVTALAISDDGEVATVGLEYYGPVGSHHTLGVMTGDELGRYLQPLGVARIVSTSAAHFEGQLSVALPENGDIAAVALDLDGARFFTDTWSAAPGPLLAQLCAASSRVLSPGEWETYFPSETYQPACANQQTSTPWDLDASPGAALLSARSSTANVRADQKWRSRYIGIVSNSFAVVTRPTYSHVNSFPHSKVQTAAKASVT